MNGGANLNRIVEVVQEALSGYYGGDQSDGVASVLRALDDHGYAIVRAGQVPRAAALGDVSDRLALAAESLTAMGSNGPSSDATKGAHVLHHLRELALNVLGIDIDDEDPEDEQ